MKKSISALSLSLVLLMVFSVCSLAFSPKEINNSVSGWLQKNISVAEAEDAIDPYLDWTTFAMSRCGNTTYVQDYKSYIGVAVSKHFDELSLADLARISLTSMSVGLNPKSIGGHNLLDAIVSCNLANEAFTGSLSYALIALNSASFSEQKQTEIKNLLLSAQRDDGGFNAYLAVDSQAYWTLSGETDSTGIVLQALSCFIGEEEIDNAVSDAVLFLRQNQMSDGGFGSWGSASAESISQVMAGLCSVGINPLVNEFTKDGKTMLTALSEFVNPDGGICCYDGSSNAMSSYQTLYGLAAYERFVDGKTGLFEMSELAELQNRIENSFIGKFSPKMSDWLCEIVKNFFNLFGIESYVYPK